MILVRYLVGDESASFDISGKLTTLPVVPSLLPLLVCQSLALSMLVYKLPDPARFLGANQLLAHRDVADDTQPYIGAIERAERTPSIVAAADRRARDRAGPPARVGP